MLSKHIEIPIIIDSDKLLRFFEIITYHYNMESRLKSQSYVPQKNRVIIEAVYVSQMMDCLDNGISCLLKFELQSKKKIESVKVIFGKPGVYLNVTQLTPIEQLDDTKIDLVVKEIKDWLQSAKTQVESEKLKTFYFVGRLLTPNCIPDGLYEFEDFVIFPLKEKGTDFFMLSNKKLYRPEGYQSGIFFNLQAVSLPHATKLSNEALQRYASILSLLIRTEIKLDSCLKEISEEKEIEYNECNSKKGSRFVINRTHLQRRTWNSDRKLEVPTDFGGLYKHYKLLNNDLRRKFEKACSSYRFGLLEMHKHKEISQLAFISAVETLVTTNSKGFCGRDCPYCGKKIEKCHNKGSGKGFKDFIANNTNTPLKELKEINKILSKSYGERGGTVHGGEFFKHGKQSFSPINEFITENGELNPDFVEFGNRLEWLEMMVHASIVNWLLSQ